jgi:cell division protein FtsI (penicillin-binding protein 3)
MRRQRTRQPAREPVVPDYRTRRRVLLAGLALGLCALIVSAVIRQVVDTDYLQDQGKRRYLRDLAIPVHRGEIRDRHGEPLALSAPIVNVTADLGPNRLTPDLAMVPALARLLDLEPAVLRDLLTRNRGRRFLYLKRSLDPEVGQAVLDLAAQQQQEVNGLALERGYRRFYPNGEVSAHVVGLTDIDERGLEGLEVTYDTWLRGTPGLRRVIQDGRGNIVEEVEGLRSPQPGKPLRLSIDRRLQFLAYRELKQAMHDHQAEGASAVILDPASGEVLAMVNQPSYNPNDRASIRPANLRNRAVTDVFEPGSTMKPLAVAAVLEAGKATPETPVDTAPGYWPVGRNIVRDHRNYGLLTVTSVLTKSSNIGVSKLALELEPESLWRSFQTLGLGQPTDSHFRGEVTGQLPYFDGWSRFEQATHSFGYGLTVTALQLARAYAVIANDGLRLPVSLLRLEQPPQGERVLRPETARAVRSMLETVVSRAGTAPEAAVEGYRVAGKTGTARKVVNGAYSRDRYRAVFAGMIPASRPRLVMAVMVDEPQGKVYYGGLVAAPVFARVMAGAMRLLNVAPDAAPATPATGPKVAAREAGR